MTVYSAYEPVVPVLVPNPPNAGFCNEPEPKLKFGADVVPKFGAVDPTFEPKPNEGAAFWVPICPNALV